MVKRGATTNEILAKIFSYAMTLSQRINGRTFNVSWFQIKFYQKLLNIIKSTNADKKKKKIFFEHVILVETFTFLTELEFDKKILNLIILQSERLHFLSWVHNGNIFFVFFYWSTRTNQREETLPKIESLCTDWMIHKGKIYTAIVNATLPERLEVKRDKWHFL